MRCEQDKDSGNEVVYDKNDGGEKNIVRCRE